MIIPFVKTYKTRVTAILSPREQDIFFEQLNADYQIRFGFLYRTAMRLREAAYFAKHPDIYRPDHGLIALPHVPGMGKDECTIRSRHILLSPNGIETVEDFIKKKITFPSYQSMDEVCKRAARDGDFKPDGIVPKMFRKIAISQQMTCFPTQQAKIAMSAGHNQGIQVEHYLIYGWKKDDITRMNDEWKAWGESK